MNTLEFGSKTLLFYFGLDIGFWTIRFTFSDSNCGASTPEYIYKMWGGEVPLKEIKAALAEMMKGE